LNVLQMFIPADRERVKENIQRKLRGEKLGEEGRYYTALRKDGTSFPVYIHTSVIIHEKKPVGLRGLLIDDTERKEAEEALRKSKEKYQALSKLQEAILKTSFDAFSVVDFKGNFLFVDKTMTKLSGYSEEELLGLHLSNITVSPEFATHLIESARQKQRTIRLETSMIPKSTAPVPVELSSDLIEAETEEEERILVVFHDLRIEKELSEEIKLFRRFTADHVFISLFKMTSKGPAVVFTEPLLFAKDEDALLMQMGVYYTTALGQGSIINLGLFGPLPVPASNLVSLVYSFLVDDPAFDDPRSKGKTYAFVVLSIPETLIQLFTNRAAIRKIFEEELGKISIVQEVDLDFLTVLKNRIIGFDEEKEVK
ncbi:MAG: PAS domain-containing protein, partial [Candidatus Hodarchaeota archaeon]